MNFFFFFYVIGKMLICKRKEKKRKKRKLAGSITWPLMWLNKSVATINVVLQFFFFERERESLNNGKSITPMKFRTYGFE